jgi:uncharacterized membrane protein HdeD (DUF308 family)
MNELRNAVPTASTASRWPFLISFFCTLAAEPNAAWRVPASHVALVWMIGWFAVVLGCLYIALAFRLKKLKQTA